MRDGQGGPSLYIPHRGTERFDIMSINGDNMIVAVLEVTPDD